MDRRNGMLKNNRGFTLMELMVAGTVGVIVAGTIFYTVSFAGNGTRQVQVLQQLQQESSLVTEMFLRTVRNGDFICVGNATGAPTQDTNNVASITIRARDSSVAATFGISSDSLRMNGSRYLTGYLCLFRSPVSHFKVFQNGKSVECYLSMFNIIGDDTVYYTQTIGRVRCKN
jgi:prepilin-type N-terminal cleavage/methylation domain-containing protein